MKVFFDTNVYVAEALLGATATRMIAATSTASWRIYTSPYVLEETERVLMRRGLKGARRLAHLSRRRIERRATLVDPAPSRHEVPSDPKDSPILRAALSASVDLLVTNDPHLLQLSPYEGLRIVSMSEYCQFLQDRGLLN